MKKLTTILMLLILSSLAFAQEDTSLDSVITQEDVEEAGTLPTSKFYKWDLFMEKFTEFFSKKAIFVHAKERIHEAKILIKQNHYDKIAEIQTRFNEKYLQLSEEQKNIIDEDKQLIQNLGQKVSAIASDGKLTEQDRIDIKNLIIEHKNSVRDNLVCCMSSTYSNTMEKINKRFQLTTEVFCKIPTSNIIREIVEKDKCSRVLIQPMPQKELLVEEIIAFDPKEEQLISNIVSDYKCDVNSIQIVEDECVKLTTLSSGKGYKNTCEDKVKLIKMVCQFGYIEPKSQCREINCFIDNCPGNHIPDVNGCINCASPCRSG